MYAYITGKTNVDNTEWINIYFEKMQERLVF